MLGAWGEPACALPAATRVSTELISVTTQVLTIEAQPKLTGEIYFARSAPLTDPPS